MGTRASRWNPFAPVNIDEQDRIFRKTRFDVSDGSHTQGEWMWVQVDSLEVDHGILANDSILDPGLVRGTRVVFRVIPQGEPLDGCAVALAWS